MKRALVILSAAAVLLPATAFTQVLPGGGGGNGGAPAQPQGGGVDNSPPAQQQGKDPLLGGALPFMDAGNETVQWDGKMWNVTNNRMFRARLEKYLASPEADTPEDEADAAMAAMASEARQ